MAVYYGFFPPQEDKTIYYSRGALELVVNAVGWIVGVPDLHAIKSAGFHTIKSADLGTSVAAVASAAIGKKSARVQARLRCASYASALAIV